MAEAFPVFVKKITKSVRPSRCLDAESNGVLPARRSYSLGEPSNRKSGAESDAGITSRLGRFVRVKNPRMVTELPRPAP